MATALTIFTFIAHKHLVAENCVNAHFCGLSQFCVIIGTKLSIDTIFSHQMFICNDSKKDEKF